MCFLKAGGGVCFWDVYFRKQMRELTYNPLLIWENQNRAQAHKWGSGLLSTRGFSTKKKSGASQSHPEPIQSLFHLLLLFFYFVFFFFFFWGGGGGAGVAVHFDVQTNSTQVLGFRV